MTNIKRDLDQSKESTPTAHQHSIHHFETCQEMAKIGSWEYSPAQDSTWWSRELYRILGLLPDTAEPQYATILERIHDGDRPWVEDTYAESLTNGKRHDITYRLHGPSEAIRHIRDRCAHQTGDDGKIIRSYGFLQDITELQETRLALAQSREEFDQFAHIASHDLQEPLRAITGFLQLLQNRYKSQLDDKGKDFIERSVKAGRQMELLIRELLQLARINSRGAAFRETDLDTIYNDVHRRLLLTIEKKKAEIRCAKLPRLTVDGEQIATVFYHLIENGLRYNISEQPKVVISCYKQDENYILSFSDNGIGIEPQFHQRIFKVFQRLHTQREYLGVGMGLTMSKRIVERHGGKIWVESEPGKGSTFYVRLPAS